MRSASHLLPPAPAGAGAGACAATARDQPAGACCCGACCGAACCGAGTGQDGVREEKLAAAGCTSAGEGCEGGRACSTTISSRASSASTAYDGASSGPGDCIPGAGRRVGGGKELGGRADSSLAIKSAKRRCVSGTSSAGRGRLDASVPAALCHPRPLPVVSSGLTNRLPP